MRQKLYESGLNRGTHISPILAPPVARAGLPKKPARKRSTRRPPRFDARAVGICKIAKVKSVQI
jgi:hypothetical protein